MTNGMLTCSARWNFGGYNRTEYPNRLHNLKDTNLEFYFLFARGLADARTHELYGHSLTDGDKFPWISGDAVAFCADRCGSTTGMKWQLDMQQSLLPRRIKHTIAVTHGTLMYISFFALTATGILSARFARSYNVRVCGSSAWFQLHRTCQLLAFTCASVGFFLIYWQAGFKTFKCATVCTDDAYAKPVHSVLGTITYALMCAQVLAGLLRPSVSSPNRQCWNWLHTANGILIFAFACTTVMFAFRLPKAGLEYFFDRTPNYFHATTVVTFISCFILLEWYSHKKRYIPEDPDRVEKLHEESQDGEDDEGVSWMPGVLMLFNFVTAVCVTAALCLMLLQAQRGYGFDL
ncbi:Protein C05D12.1 [Aphelenchoides avenae]|nr:Protein C05D12.1 [Aphelenchus avenae]